MLVKTIFALGGLYVLAIVVLSVYQRWLVRRYKRNPW